MTVFLAWARAEAALKRGDESASSERFNQAGPPGSIAYALDYLIDHGLDNNDATGAPAYDPAVPLKIVLLPYNRGQISCRDIKRSSRKKSAGLA